jgi:hypothetical protein
MRMKFPAWLGSPARQRMSVLATSTMLFVMVDSGFDVIGPLWTTSELGLPNSGWAFIRAARFSGTLAGILVFGILVERIGSRWMSALVLGGAGLAFAAMASGVPVRWVIPLYGAFTCALYVNLNVLTQRVSARRQGLANVIYRAVGGAAAVIAPVLATQAGQAAGSYAPVIMAGAVLLGLGGLAILFYPEVPQSGSPRALTGVLTAYRRCFALRPLLVLLILDQSFACTAAPVVAFAAIRFTRQLHYGETDFGVLCTAIAVGGLLIILASGWLMERLRPNNVLGLAWLGCSFAAVALGLSDSLAVAILAYAVHVPLLAMRSVPESLWVSRIADAAGPDGPSQAMAFTVQKLWQAGTNVLMMSLVGILEPHFGIPALMLCGGLIGLPLSFAVMRLGVIQERKKEVSF